MRERFILALRLGNAVAGKSKIRVRVGEKIDLAHPVFRTRAEFRVEVEGRTTAAKDESQLILGVLDRIIDGGTCGVIEQNSVIGQLKERQVSIGKRIFLAPKSVAE